MSSSDSVEKKLCVEIDRISSLPDSVLSRILSFMETKLSVQTCVLSKRWKSLWTYVSRFHFYHLRSDKEEELITKKVVDFEKLVTLSLFMNRCEFFDTFQLECLKDAERVILYPAWLTAVVTSNVRVLDLHLVSSDSMSVVVNLPNCIFTAKSLEILRLEGDLLVKTPVSVSLPKLECLSLRGVRYGCADSFRKLIGGCPVLKSLYVRRERFDNVGVFTVSSDTLERLHILARSFAIKEDIDMKLEIKAPFLKYLNLCDYVSKSFSFGPLPDLDELHLCHFRDAYELTYFDDSHSLYDFQWIWGLLDETLCERLKVLSIGDEEILDLVAGSSKVFPTLTNLILTSSSSWATLLQLLGKTENLKALSLKERCCFEVNENYKAPPPRCLLSSIERISVISWLPSPYSNPELVEIVVANEFNWDTDIILATLKYFLKHGEILRRLEITYPVLDVCDIKYSHLHDAAADDAGESGGGRRLRRNSFRDVLLSLKRKSSACEIHATERLFLDYFLTDC